MLEEGKAEDPSNTGIPPKFYLGRYKSSDDYYDSTFNYESEDFGEKPRKDRGDKTKDKQKFFRDSKLNGSWFKKKKGKESGLKSILKPRRTEAFPDHPAERSGKTAVTINDDPKCRASPDTPDCEELTQRRVVYKNCDIEKNAANYVLHKATMDIHMFKVELERDHAFGFGLYIYGKGPNREVPSVSIFVNSVVPRSTADRTGLIKAYDQIIKCNKKSFVGTTAEEAMKELKNNTKLVLVLGRRESILEGEELSKDIAKVMLDYSRSKWVQAKSMESGDFNLISPHSFIGSLPKPQSQKGRKKAKAISLPLKKIDSFNPTSTLLSKSHSPTPSPWLERQMHLEQQAMADRRKKDEAIRQAEKEKEDYERRSEMKIDFLKKQYEATRSKLEEVSVHLQAARIEEALQASSSGSADIMGVWDDTLAELESWDNTSVGTELTESTIQGGGGYTNLMEMPVEEIQEMLSNPTTPSLSQYSERFKFDSNYSSRRPSTQLGLTDSSCQSSNRSSRVGVEMFDDHTPRPTDLCTYENVRHISLEKDAAPNLSLDLAPMLSLPPTIRHSRDATSDIMSGDNSDANSEEYNPPAGTSGYDSPEAECNSLDSTDETPTTCPDRSEWVANV